MNVLFLSLPLLLLLFSLSLVPRVCVCVCVCAWARLALAHPSCHFRDHVRFLFSPRAPDRGGGGGDQIPGFDVSTAWEAIHKDSFTDEPGGHDGVGKAGLRYYDQHKYIPSDVGVSEMVSRSLDFAFADAAVANAADFLAGRATSLTAKVRERRRRRRRRASSRTRTHAAQGRVVEGQGGAPLLSLGSPRRAPPTPADALFNHGGFGISSWAPPPLDHAPRGRPAS